MKQFIKFGVVGFTNQSHSNCSSFGHLSDDWRK